MAGDGVCIVIYTGNHLRAFLSADTGSFHARGGATCATEEVDVEEFDHDSPLSILLANSVDIYMLQSGQTTKGPYLS